MGKTGFDTGFPSETVNEGKVKVVVPELKAFVKHPSDYAPSKAPVFYNPVMELNRDLAVLAVQAYRRTVDREISICEPLTSSGIRGVRFATEIPNSKVTISDINEKAFKLATLNVQLNELQERISVYHTDANCLLSCHGAPRKRFDVVDVDPFGSPVSYLDSAVRALRNNGLLAVTATDLAPLCGVQPKACIRKYGGKPLRTEYCHELAIRLLAGCVAKMAGKHDVGTRILFSYSRDHYIRIYVEIAYGAKKADYGIKNVGYVLHCFNCFHRETARDAFSGQTSKCPECGFKMDFAGPLWLGKIFDKQFCEAMAKENARSALRNSGKISRLLALAKDEAEAPMTYFVLDEISSKLSLPVPSIDSVRPILLDNGFLAVPTHFNSRGLRTDAPALVMQKFLQKTITGG